MVRSAAGLGCCGMATRIRSAPRVFSSTPKGPSFPASTSRSQSWDLETADFRWGLPLTYGRGPWEYKLAYYHLSSHLGDEYMVSHPNVNRINFVRDAFVLGAAYRYREALRIYGEVGYLFHNDGGAKPWEFQFGAEYSQLARRPECAALPSLPSTPGSGRKSILAAV